jgi:hypothetical protein
MQRDRCGACDARQRPGGKRLSIDHNHADLYTTGWFPRGLIRGLLCQRCNSRLTEDVIAQVEGRGQDGPMTLRTYNAITAREETITVTARQVAYIMDPPAKSLWLVMPEDLVVRWKQKKDAAAQRARDNRAATRERELQEEPPPPPEPPVEDVNVSFDVDPDDRWATPPVEEPPRVRELLRGEREPRRLSPSPTFAEALAWRAEREAEAILRAAWEAFQEEERQLRDAEEARRARRRVAVVTAGRVAACIGVVGVVMLLWEVILTALVTGAILAVTGLAAMHAS